MMPSVHKYTWMLIINLFLVAYNIGLYNMIKERIAETDPAADGVIVLNAGRNFTEELLQQAAKVVQQQQQHQSQTEMMNNNQTAAGDMKEQGASVEVLQEEEAFPQVPAPNMGSGDKEAEGRRDSSTRKVTNVHPAEGTLELSSGFNVSQIKEKARAKYEPARKQIQTYCRLNMRMDPHLRYV